MHSPRFSFGSYNSLFGYDHGRRDALQRYRVRGADVESPEGLVDVIRSSMAISPNGCNEQELRVTDAPTSAHADALAHATPGEPAHRRL